MENTEKYNVKWNNFNKIWSFNFYQFFNEQKYCDVALSSAEGKSIKAHRIILAACSPYFDKLFTSSTVNPTERQIIVMSQMKHEDIMTVLEFAYTGEVSVPAMKWKTFKLVAKLLELKGWGDEEDSGENKKLPPTPPRDTVALDAEQNVDETVNPFAEKPEVSTPVVELVKKARGRPRKNTIGCISDLKPKKTMKPLVKPIPEKVKEPQEDVAVGTGDKVVSPKEIIEAVDVKIEPGLPEVTNNNKRKADSIGEDQEIKPTQKAAKLSGKPGNLSPTVKCKFCDKEYTKNSLGGHQGNCKLNPDRKVFKCNICHKELSRSDKLKQHMKTHNRSSL